MPEAEMRNASLSGLDLLEGLPWSCDEAEGHVWVSGPDGVRGQVDVGGLVLHLMPYGYLVCATAWGHADFCWAVLFQGPCECGCLCYSPETGADWVPATTKGQV